MERSGSFSSTNVSYQQLDNQPDNEPETNQSTQSTTQTDNQTTSQHPKITICFRTLSGQVMRVELPTIDPATNQPINQMTVGYLKQALESAHQIPVTFQRLIFGGRELTDDITLRQANIEDQSMIHLLLRQINQPNAPVVNQPVNPALQGLGFDHTIEVMNNEPVAPYNEDVELIYQIGRSIRVLALIDALWLILISMKMSPFFNFGLCLAIIGFVGAHLYRRDLTVALLGFICLSVASRVMYMIENQQIAIYIFLSLAIVIDVYLMRLVTLFIKKLRGITPADRAELLSRNRMRMNAF